MVHGREKVDPRMKDLDLLVRSPQLDPPSSDSLSVFGYLAELPP